MMKWMENMAVKALAFIVAVAAFAAAAIMGWYQAANFEVIWGDYGPGDGYTITYMQRRDCQNIAYLLNLYNWESLGSSLDAFQIQEKARLESALLDTTVTNLRWQAADREENVRFGNAEGAVPVPVQGLYTSDFSWATASYSVSIFRGSWQDAAKNAVNVCGAFVKQ